MILLLLLLQCAFSSVHCLLRNVPLQTLFSWTRSSRIYDAAGSEKEQLHAFGESILEASSAASRLQLLPTFQAYANNAFFKSNIWQKQPYLCTHSLPNVAGAFTMSDLKDVVDNEFLEAGRGTFQEGRGGWNMASVSQVIIPLILC